MFEFIDILKTIATILITNSHFDCIWPNASFAFGGLLGDLFFFAISGYCLYNIRSHFYGWYLERIIRIYPAIIIFGFVGLILGFYKIDIDPISIVKYIIYPTHYHFIASIMVLYIGYYWLNVLDKKGAISFKYSMLIIAIIAFIIYIFCYDKTYYHIDSVEEKYIRFLFFESMLLGGLLHKISEKNPELIVSRTWGGGILCMTFVYFISKIVFSKVEFLSYIQIINQIVVFAYMAVIFMFFLKMQLIGKYKKINVNLMIGIRFIASLTLEIYIVQLDVIHRISYMVFPYNFIVVTICIIGIASLIHLGAKYISEGLMKILSKILERSRVYDQ